MRSREKNDCQGRYAAYGDKGIKAAWETGTFAETVRRIDPIRRKIILARKKGLGGAYEEIDIDRVVRIVCE